MNKALTDAQYVQQRQRVRRLATKWQRLLGMQAWQVRWKFDRSGAPRFGSEDHADVLGARTLMESQADWQYKTLNVAVNMPALPLYRDQIVEEVLIHELCHGLVNEMHGAPKEGEDETSLEVRERNAHEESVVTAVSQAILRVHRLSAHA